MNEPQFFHRTFSELSTSELYQILALRSEVFVLEQQCAYQDMDGLDARSIHIMAQKDQHIFAYARILPPERHSKGHSSIGRVVVAASQRKDQWGKKLMTYAIAQARKIHPDAILEISAQSYLTHFYKGLGFVNTGAFYLEDNIPHQTMVYRPASSD